MSLEPRVLPVQREKPFVKVVKKKSKRAKAHTKKRESGPRGQEIQSVRAKGTCLKRMGKSMRELSTPKKK